MPMFGSVSPMSWSTAEQLCYERLDGAYCFRSSSIVISESAEVVTRGKTAVRTRAAAIAWRCSAATDAASQSAARSFERDLSTCVRSL